MTDDAVREAYRRVAAILRDLNPEDQADYYRACVIVSDLGSEPFGRVWELCVDEP